MLITRTVKVLYKTLVIAKNIYHTELGTLPSTLVRSKLIYTYLDNQYWKYLLG